MLRKSIVKLHLWLGLGSGLVVFIVSVTGCLYAFQEEIRMYTEDFRQIPSEQGELLPPSAMLPVAEKLLPGKSVHAVMYNGRTEAAQIILYSFEPEYYYIIYVNPYSGLPLRVVDMERDFFHLVLDGHFYLWLPPNIGQPVVASATLVFVIMIATGLFLWGKGNKKKTDQRFRIKWNARWRRLNYDLHNVPGFYVSVLALLLSLTGLVWGFQWFAKGYYALAGGTKSLIYSEPESDTTRVVSEATLPIDHVYSLMKTQYPDARSIEVHIPESKTSPIAANANPAADTYWKMDYRYFDQYTKAELDVAHVYGRFDQADRADKLIRMNYDIHTGAILGLPGKILAFCASLVCASLPVTGVIIWWGRRNKKTKEPASKRKKENLVYQ